MPYSMHAQHGFLQLNYESMSQWLFYSDTYGLAERLGYESAQQAWHDNPFIQWSSDPRDFCKLRDRTPEDDETLHAKLAAAGCKLDHHQSDLYVEDTPTARQILADMNIRFKRFKSKKPEDNGATWLDVPLMWQPFWDAKAMRATA